MRPRFHPTLVNGRYGDPALFIDLLMERRALLFDLGDIAALPGRSVLRLTDVFVSHAHMDHFFGFDHLLRLLVGRGRTLRLYGPEGFIDRVAARLAGYTWNLVDSYEAELSFAVTEVAGDRARRARFRLRNRFAREDCGEGPVRDGLLLEEPSVTVRCAGLEHGTPVLAFALQEAEHVNIWRNRLDELGFDTGPWLTGLKRAIFAGQTDDTPIEVRRRSGEADRLPLGWLREQVVSITPGQKIAYVTDAANTDPEPGADRRPGAGCRHAVHRIGLRARRRRAGRGPKAPDHRAGRGHGPRGRGGARRAVPHFAPLCRAGGDDAGRGGGRVPW